MTLLACEYDRHACVLTEREALNYMRDRLQRIVIFE
jgi:hypothetical protein